MALSIKDLEDSKAFPDMFTVLEEPCPVCNKELLMGDWVCWGFCYECYREKEENGYIL